MSTENKIKQLETLTSCLERILLCDTLIKNNVETYNAWAQMGLELNNTKERVEKLKHRRRCLNAMYFQLMTGK